MKILNVIFIFLLGIFIFGCDPKEDPEKSIETGTVTDVQGNVYKTVKIGDQWWMAENLKVKMYRDGTFLQNIENENDWSNAMIGAYCIYENGHAPSPPPGLLYNWFAINNSKGLAPDGWHIPTDDEWQKLEQSIGMSGADAMRNGWRGTKEGDKLKVASPNGWTEFENVWSTNESGFTALAGGCRLPNATYGQPALFSTGFWWTTTESNPDEAYYRYLDYKNSNVFRNHDSKRYGFSVRCVKD
jgi:uncharacterized protein (TIGR02145 family)